MIGKLSGMFYEVSEREIVLEVVKEYNSHPDIHISKLIHTDSKSFWKFLLNIMIELQHSNDIIIRNEEKEYDLESIEKAKKGIEILKKIEENINYFLN